MRILKDDKNHMGTNSYLLIKDNKECFIIDAASKLDAFQEIIDQEGLNLKYIMLTHGHFDHVLGVEDLVNKYGAKIVAHIEEKDVLTKASVNLSNMIGKIIEFDADIYLEGQEGTFEDFTYLFTPGHTSGGVSYKYEDHVFTGDTVFRASIGRTDFPGGDYDTLIKSIRDKIFTLDHDTTIYPGHGPNTSVEYEINNNPFLR